MKIFNKYKMLNARYKRGVAWLLALAIVVPPYFAVFSPRVFAQLRETSAVLGEFFAGGESSKYAFIGIDPESNGSEVYFFNDSDNVRITNDRVTNGGVQYDEFSNKIVYQSLLDGVWQVFLYDVATDTTMQLSFEGGNNLDSQISQGQVAWRSWVDNNWEVYFYDGAITQRLTLNSDPDIEPKLSNGYVAWSQYEPDIEGESSRGIDPDKYAVIVYDSLKKETKKISSRGRGNNNVSMEYPYVVWQIYDGNDNEISIYNLADGTVALLTANEHDDLAPKIKKGKITWFENVKVAPVALPPNIIVEDDQVKLELQPEGTLLPDWWEEPSKLCPDQESVCGYVDEEFQSYANRCYVEKNSGVVVHIGFCNGEETVADLQLIEPMPEDTTVSPSFTPELVPDEEVAPSQEASPSVSFEPSPEASASEDNTVEPSPLISPSQGFEATATPEPTSEVDPEFLQKGNFETTGSFDEDGNVVIEERSLIDSDTPPSETSSASSVVEDSVPPMIFEESTLMKAGEVINTAITDTASATANLLINLVGENNESGEPAASLEPSVVEESVPAQESIPVEQ